MTTTVLATLGLLVGILTWWAQLRDRRLEQYWRLVTMSQTSPKIHEVQTALLLLPKYPEFRAITLYILDSAVKKNDPWMKDYHAEVLRVMLELENMPRWRSYYVRWLG